MDYELWTKNVSPPKGGRGVFNYDLRSSLLTLGKAGTSSTLLSLNRSLEL